LAAIDECFKICLPFAGEAEMNTFLA